LKLKQRLTLKTEDRFMARKTAANPTGLSTLSAIVKAHAMERPEGVAFIERGREMSWLAYHLAANRLATLLMKLGYEREDLIAILMPDSLETHIAFLACERAGLISVAITPRAGIQEIAHISSIANAKCLLTTTEYGGVAAGEVFKRIAKNKDSELSHHIIIDGPSERYLVDGEVIDDTTLSILGPLPETSAEAVFLLNTTSGTTGMPKCVKQHQARWFAYAEYVQDAYPVTKDDVFMRAVPSSVGFGLWSGHFIPTLLGATTIILPKFSVSTMLQDIEAYKVTVLAAVSTQFIMALNSDSIERHNLASLAVLFTGGESVPYSKALEFEKRVGTKVLQFYGSNETGAISYTRYRDTQELRLKTAGNVIQSMDVSLLVDSSSDQRSRTGVGQPICRGPLMSYGYYNNDEGNSKLFTHDGYMTMEDKVEIDEIGYVKVIGRLGDFIIRGGKNISAAAVESYALRHPKIRLAAALPVPDVVYGERVGLAVVFESGVKLDLGDLVSFLLDEGVSKSYFPEKLYVITEMPMASGGKISKSRLCEQLFSGIGTGA